MTSCTFVTAAITTKTSLTVSNNCRWTCGVCTWSCFYQRCCQVRAARESIAMVMFIAHPLLFSHSAMCAAEPTPPNITRNISGPALNGPVVFRANNVSSSWCSAIFLSHRTSKDFLWQCSNGARLPVVNKAESSDMSRCVNEKFVSIYIEYYMSSWHVCILHNLDIHCVTISP